MAARRTRPLKPPKTPPISTVTTSSDSRPGPKNITEAMYAAAIRKQAAIYSLIAEQLGVSRAAVSQRIGNSPKLQAVVADTEEARLDQSEGVIVQGLVDKDKQTARWYLERKGGKRGYGNKVDVTARLPDPELEAFVEAIGGDVERLRAVRAAIASTGLPPPGKS